MDITCLLQTVDKVPSESSDFSTFIAVFMV